VAYAENLFFPRGGKPRRGIFASGGRQKDSVIRHSSFDISSAGLLLSPRRRGRLEGGDSIPHEMEGAMKRPLLIALWVLLLLCGQLHAQQIEVYFSPKGGCTAAIVKEIDAAKASIFVQAYSFTSAPIAKALTDAHKRKLKVEVILDKSQVTDKYSEADFLNNADIPTRIDSLHAIAHNKLMVIDGQVVITGSFNFTKAAEESNAENVLVIRDKALAEKYLANWEKHAEHSGRYLGKPTGADGGRGKPSIDKAAGRSPTGEGKYWLTTSSGIRHNESCKYYQTSKGRVCGKDDGRACKICGG
jgi:hypothetical protein